MRNLCYCRCISPSHVNMPDLIPGFVKISDVGAEYKTSRKTVERRRDRARDTGDPKTFRMFRLRTKDGEAFTEPSVEQVNALTREGRVPEWFVARSWLEKEFGRREQGSESLAKDSSGPAVPPQVEPLIAAIRQQYEERITDLKDQLAAAERREQRIAESAERDKQRFATATTQLTQVLALPSIAAAKQAERDSTVTTDADKRGESDARVQADEGTAERTNPRKTVTGEDARGWWRRLIPRQNP